MSTREPTTNETPTDFSWKGDTWYPVERDCPDCGQSVFSNGTIHQCAGSYEHTDEDCTWWGIIE